MHASHVFACLTKALRNARHATSHPCFDEKMHVDVLNEIGRSLRHSKTSFQRQTGHSVEPPRIEPVVSKAHRSQPMTTTRLMEVPDENVSEWPREASESCDDKPMTTTRLMEAPTKTQTKTDMRSVTDIVRQTFPWHIVRLLNCAIIFT